VAYATIEQLRAYLPQIKETVSRDDLLADVLDRATAIVDRETGLAFGTAAAGSRTAYGDGTAWLVPPHYTAGSLTAVTTISGWSVPAYTEQDGMLVARSSSGILGLNRAGDPFLGWAAGVPYTVAATFGYADVPADITECTLELAVRIWRARDAGFSDVVGVQGGGAVGYNGALPALVKRILEGYKRRESAGVW
jgi:hypothetical protein